MEIISLSQVDFQTIYQAFRLAFADYEVQLDRNSLLTMLKRRGFDPTLSFAAFENQEIIAFTLNGVGQFGGIPTAYDTGTGTLPDYRGKGLATQIFEHSIPFLRESNIHQYLLEVLQHNERAVSVYKKLGFEVRREFNYFIQKIGEVDDRQEDPAPEYLIRKVGLQEIRPGAKFWDFTPSWQNSFEAIERSAGDFTAFGAFLGKDLVGYAVFEPVSGDLTQIAVDRQHRRKGIASRLFREAMKINLHGMVKIINTEPSCDAITGFLRSKGISIKGKQYEMVKKLS